MVFSNHYQISIDMFGKSILHFLRFPRVLENLTLNLLKIIRKINRSIFKVLVNTLKKN